MTDSWKDREEEPCECGADQSVGSGMPGSEISFGLGGWNFVFESKYECCQKSECWAEYEKSHRITVISDLVSPDDSFVEGVEKYAEKAQNEYLKRSNPACKGHIGNKHRKGAYNSFGKSYICVKWGIEPNISWQYSEHFELSLCECICVGIVS